MPREGCALVRMVESYVRNIRLAKSGLINIIFLLFITYKFLLIYHAIHSAKNYLERNATLYIMILGQKVFCTHDTYGLLRALCSRNP